MSQEHETGLSIDLKDKRIVLLLQGGGALGAYQIGAYEILQGLCTRKMCKIDWVAGISIGAVNAAVIAGNSLSDLLPTDIDHLHHPEDRLLQKGERPSRLEKLWDKILSPYTALKPFEEQYDSWLNSLSLLLPWSPLAGLLPKYAGWNMAAWGGQSNFFQSRFLRPWLNPWITQWAQGSLPPDSLANYSVKPLSDTLDGLVDWELINNPAREDRTLISLGATGVDDAEVRFFNSFTPRSHEGLKMWGPGGALKVDHVLASAALPPAFPAVCIEGKYYWDGGISSNTPLFDLRYELATQDTIVFDVLLWDRRGSLPKTMDELMWRQKCIQFGSRKKVAELIVENYGRYAQEAATAGKKPAKLEVVQIMYETDDGGRQKDGGEKKAEDPIFWFEDADFSRSSFEKLRRTGRKDMFRTLHNPDWVKAVGEYAVLYRHGTHRKHLKSDPSGGPWTWKPGPISVLRVEQTAPATAEVRADTVDEIQPSDRQPTEKAPEPKSRKAATPSAKRAVAKIPASAPAVAPGKSKK